MNALVEVQKVDAAKWLDQLLAMEEGDPMTKNTHYFDDWCECRLPSFGLHAEEVG